MRESVTDLVSVIVPTLGRETLRPLLERVAAQRPPFPFEVVLVPQGPLPPDLPIGESVRVVPAAAGRGFAHVRNVGLAAARGDPVVFIDDDALPGPEWLGRLVEPVRAGRASAATADLRVPLGRGALADAISRLGFPGGAAAGWRALWPVADDGTTGHLCTGNCALSRDAIDRVGPFDETLVDGSEDVDLGDRLVAAGLRIVHVEPAAVEHAPRTGLASFFRWNLRRGRSAWDLSRRRRVGGHVRGRLRSSLRILRRHAPTRHGPPVLGVMALQYAAQTLGYLQARAGHRPGTRRPEPPAEAAAPPSGLVTVVVPSRNRERDLARCLEALRCQMYARVEILVVDNGSTDGTPALLAAASGLDPRVRHVREETPGLGHARNLGIREARGEIVAFIDDDAVPPPGWLECLLRGFSRPEIGGCGGPARPLWEQPPPHAVLRSLRARAYLGEYDRGPRARPVAWLIGANCAYRRAVFETCGPFRTDLDRVGGSLRSGGDVEMGLRAGARWPLRYEPEAWVNHGVSARKLSWRYLLGIAFVIGRGRAEDGRGGRGSGPTGRSPLDLVLAAVAGAGWLVGKLGITARPAER